MRFSKVRLLPLLFGVSLLSACRWQQSELQARTSLVSEGPVLYATDRFKLEDTRDFYKRVFGRDEYSVQWAELDRYRSGSGIIERRPYVDSWYPERTGGTNLTGALTRYDKAFYAGEAKAAVWEATEHGRAEPAWFGHCNGTSAASIRYLNPVQRVLRPKGCTAGAEGCTEFSPTDVRALLSEISMSAKPKFLAGTRCKLTRAELDARPALRLSPTVMDDCDDVNPGSFHAALVNFTGRMKQPLVFDYNQDEEVWNYPVYGYSYVADGPLTEGQAVAATGLPIDSWVFNSRAVSWYRVTMTVNYRESTFAVDASSGSNPVELSRKVYEYLIELDDENNVLGGEWIGESRRDHPDFIWMPFEPVDPSGDVSSGNPLVKNEEVIKIWAESVGLNPDDPFRDKPNNPFDIRFFPLEDEAWGVVAGYYHLILDGSDHGSVFLGKKTHLRINVNENLKTDATVEVLLNGQSLGSVSPQEGKVDLLFDPKEGVNLLSLRWTSARINPSELNWDFRFFAM